MSDETPFSRLLDDIPEALRAEARQEAIGDTSPPDAATLLVYDLLRDRLDLTHRIEDVTTGARAAALSLLLARELADQGPVIRAAAIEEIAQVVATIAGANPAERESVLRMIAGGFET